MHNVHVCNMKPCFPTAKEVEDRTQENLRKIFHDTSDEDEDFLGF